MYEHYKYKYMYMFLYLAVRSYRVYFNLLRDRTSKEGFYFSRKQELLPLIWMSTDNYEYLCLEFLKYMY